MATVEKCSYCNRDLSSDLNRCPHCKKVVPRLVSCKICDQELNSAEAVLLLVYENKRDEAYFSCRQCYKIVLNEQICPTCKKVFPETQQKSINSKPPHFSYDYAIISCENCGQPNIRYFWCGICRKPVIEGNNAGDYRRRYNHHVCGVKIQKFKQKAEKERQEEEERKLEKLIAEGRCLKCKEKLGFFDKLFGRTKHSYHI